MHLQRTFTVGVKLSFVQLIAETAEANPAVGGADSSGLLDWASLAVAVLVGVGSAWVTAKMQSRLEVDKQHQSALLSLVNYERALGDAEGSLEADEVQIDGPPFPGNLDELRMEAYPHFRFLKETGNENDKRIYLLLNAPASGPHKSLPEAVEAFAEAHQAASDAIKRFEDRGGQRFRWRFAAKTRESAMPPRP